MARPTTAPAGPRRGHPRAALRPAAGVLSAGVLSAGVLAAGVLAAVLVTAVLVTAVLVTAVLALTAPSAAARAAAVADDAAPAASTTAVTLVAASPPPGSVLNAGPGAVELDFSRTLSGGGVTISGPEGGVAAGPAVVAGVTVSRPLDPDLAPGEYTVSWTAKPSSGQKATGSYTFRVVAASSPEPSPPAPSPSATGSVPGRVMPSVPATAPASGAASAPTATGPGPASPTAGRSAASPSTPATVAAAPGSPTGPAPSGGALPAVLSGSGAGGGDAVGSHILPLALLALAGMLLLAAAGWVRARRRRVGPDGAPAGVAASPAPPSPSGVQGAASGRLPVGARTGPAQPADLFSPRPPASSGPA